MKKIISIITLLIIVISMSSCGVKQENNVKFSSDYEDAMQLRNSVVYNVENKDIINVSSFEDGDTLCVDILTDTLEFPHEEVFNKVSDDEDKEQYFNELKAMVGLSKDTLVGGTNLGEGFRLENGYLITFFKESLNNYYICLQYLDTKEYNYKDKINYSFNYIKNNMGVDLSSNEDFNKVYNGFFNNKDLNVLSIIIQDENGNIGVSLLFNKLILGHDDYYISKVRTDIYNYNYNALKIEDFIYNDVVSNMDGVKGINIAHQINEEVYNVELIVDNLIFPNEEKFSQISDKNINEYMYLLEELVSSKYNRELSLLYGAENVLIDDVNMLNALFFKKDNNYFYTSVEYLLGFDSFYEDLDKGFNFINKNYNINLKQCTEFMDIYNKFINDKESELLYFSILGENDEKLSIDIIIDKSVGGDYGSFLIQNVRMLS